MPVTLLPSIVYKEIGNIKLYMDIIRPATPGTFPTAVGILGFGAYLTSHYEVGTTSNCCPLVAAHGFVTASIQVRTSFEAQYPAQIEDVKDAIRFLKANAATFDLNPDRIGIWGHSAGGHLAALAGLMKDEGKAASAQVQAVVVGSSPADFLDFGGYFQADHPVLTQLFGGRLTNHEDLARAASPIKHVTKDAPPFLIAHGTLDETIPFRHAELLRDKFREAGVEVDFVELKNCYHNWSKELEPESGEGNEGQLNVLALEFFQKHLA